MCYSCGYFLGHFCFVFFLVKQQKCFEIVCGNTERQGKAKCPDPVLQEGGSKGNAAGDEEWGWGERRFVSRAG